VLQSLAGTSTTDLASTYERYYEGLAALAEKLEIPPEEAEELIANILISTLLLKRPAGDVERWLVAALHDAARGEKC
jgi:hypothetical protein